MKTFLTIAISFLMFMTGFAFQTPKPDDQSYGISDKQYEQYLEKGYLKLSLVQKDMDLAQQRYQSNQMAITLAQEQMKQAKKDYDDDNNQMKALQDNIVTEQNKLKKILGISEKEYSIFVLTQGADGKYSFVKKASQ